jgi:hypothetical protein
MDRQEISPGSRLLLGAIGLMALTGCYIALAKLANDDGSPVWNMCALVAALAVCGWSMAGAFQRTR